jgi:hypothetical protein
MTMTMTMNSNNSNSSNNGALKTNAPDRVKPLQAIRAMCLTCQTGKRQKVKNCVMRWCPLYLFRFGKNQALVLAKKSADEKLAAQLRAKKAREVKALLRAGMGVGANNAV